MFQRTRIMLAMVAGSTVFALAIIGSMPEQHALAVVDNSTFLTSTQAMALWGSGCESGCEEVSNRCVGQENALCAIHNPMGGDNPNEPGYYMYQGSECTQCQHNSNREKCADWGYCITWPINTCTKCVTDTAFECGVESYGLCYLGHCQIENPDIGSCGTNFQCHTEDQ